MTITLPLSQEELAGWTGSSREAVTKALRTLRELGWIETGRREISVTRPRGSAKVRAMRHSAPLHARGGADRAAVGRGAGSRRCATRASG